MSRHSQLSRSRLAKVRALLKSGRLEEAARVCEKLCAGTGADVDTWVLLADIYSRLGRPQQALACDDRAIDLAQCDPDAYIRKANRLVGLNAPEQAMDCYRLALTRCPEDPRLLTNHAALLMGMLRHSEAEPLLRRAVALDASLSQPFINLGSCLNAQGKTGDAIAMYREALKTIGNDPVLYSNYLMARQYLEDGDADENLRAHMAWSTCYSGDSALRLPPAGVDRQDGRALRIGYVSADFRAHSVAYFLLPLLRQHDRDAFDIYCYSNVARPDDTTARIRDCCRNWRDIKGENDAAVASRIRQDGIDVLVDLAGHTAGNRLGVFVHKPAPVQMTWLGYPDTTGVPAIDYRISDGSADPPGAERACTEQLVRLDGSFLCYEPPADAPAVAAAPCADTGSVTFGSFNNLAKINAAVLATWVEILRELPGTRLFIKNPGLTDAASRERLQAFFAERGIEAARLTCAGVSRTTREHLAEYRHVDIALDTFPYNGTTTTCEALWMGVPVVTLTGDRHAARVGSSLLAAAGLDEWVATTREDYIHRALDHAANPPGLAALRAVMRQRLQGSLLCDATAFAQRMESLYRTVWRERCCGGDADGA